MTTTAGTTRTMHRSHALDGDADSLRDLYQGWAEAYDSDVTEDGYVAPLMISLLAAQHQDGTGDSRVLDMGCGTGLVGEQLARLAPVATLVGADLSEEMAEIARRRDCYDEVAGEIDLNAPLPQDWSGSFDSVICCGTFTNGHVGPERIEPLLQTARPGGLLTLSVRHGFSAERDFAGAVSDLISAGSAELVSEVVNGPYIREEGADYWCLART